MAQNIELTNSDIEKVSSLKMFFGHQSVGYNILNGISDITQSVDIIESSSLPDNDVFLLHSRVGGNTRPESKIDDFSKIINNIGYGIDVAFLKFCYVDVSSDTDVHSLFSSYKKTITALEEMFPNINFIHFTVPLTTIQKGPKALVKRVLGRSVGIDDNIKRQQYNEFLREEYSGKEQIFDIAAIESTKPDGSRMNHEKGGYTFFSMYEEYTDDGGHLNETGRRIVAERLIKLLSQIK